MRYVAAYLLAVLGGNGSPKAKDIKQILSSVAVDIDDDSLSKVIKELEGKNLKELIAEGHSKLASVPAGGAAVVSASAAPVAVEAPAETKKEEKKEESEESDEDMGFGLFD